MTLTANVVCAILNVALFGWVSFAIGNNLSNGGGSIARFLIYSGAGIVAGISISVSFMVAFIVVKMHHSRK